MPPRLVFLFMEGKLNLDHCPFIDSFVSTVFMLICLINIKRESSLYILLPFSKQFRIPIIMSYYPSKSLFSAVDLSYFGLVEVSVISIMYIYLFFLATQSLILS